MATQRAGLCWPLPVSEPEPAGRVARSVGRGSEKWGSRVREEGV